MAQPPSFPPKPAPLLNVNLRWFLTAMILANIAGNMAYSMLSLYLIELGADVTQVGLVFTVASLVPMTLQIVGGWLSDTIGRLRVIALGSAVAVFGYLLFFISPSWEWVMIGLCLEYVSNAMVGPSFNAYIAEQSTEAQRGRVFGLTKSIYLTVTVIGPALAGFLAYRLNFRAMLLAALIFYAAATAVRVWMGLAERFAPVHRLERPTLAGFRTQIGAMALLLMAGGILTWIWLTDAVSDMAYNLIGQLYPIYMSDIGKLNLAQIGLVNSLWGMATILAAFLAGWIADRRDERTVMVAGFLIEALGLIVLIQATGFWFFGIGMAIFGLGVGCLIPAYDTLISKVVPEHQRGLAYGLFGTSLGVLSLPMPWIGAQLWQHIAPQAPFWITVAASFISAFIAWLKFGLPARLASASADSRDG